MSHFVGFLIYLILFSWLVPLSTKFGSLGPHYLHQIHILSYFEITALITDSEPYKFFNNHI